MKVSHFYARPKRLADYADHRLDNIFIGLNKRQAFVDFASLLDLSSYGHLGDYKAVFQKFLSSQIYQVNRNIGYYKSLYYYFAEYWPQSCEDLVSKIQDVTENVGEMFDWDLEWNKIVNMFASSLGTKDEYVNGILCTTKLYRLLTKKIESDQIDNDQVTSLAEILKRAVDTIPPIFLEIRKHISNIARPTRSMNLDQVISFLKDDIEEFEDVKDEVNLPSLAKDIQNEVEWADRTKSEFPLDLYNFGGRLEQFVSSINTTKDELHDYKQNVRTHEGIIVNSVRSAAAIEEMVEEFVELEFCVYSHEAILLVRDVEKGASGGLSRGGRKGSKSLKKYRVNKSFFFLTTSKDAKREKRAKDKYGSVWRGRERDRKCGLLDGSIW